MTVDLRKNAEDDIRKLRTTNKPAAAAVMVALEQIEADPKAIDKLTTHGDDPDVGKDDPVRLGIKRWETAKRHSVLLWRFRIFDTPATVYRVVYGYHWQTKQICILAVIHKEEFDYDNLDSDIAKRILDDWRAI
ncbi:MAG: type II toxin-antitoxin system RelE family toxin [Burkholderiales bacterium]